LFWKNGWLAQEGWIEMKVAKARYSKRWTVNVLYLTVGLSLREVNVDSRGRENALSSQR